MTDAVTMWLFTAGTFFVSVAAVKRISGFLSLFTIIAVLGVAPSCVRVKPYERETHSKKTMQDPDKLEAKLDGHVQEYREGSVGGDGVGGGGCGCN